MDSDLFTLLDIHTVNSSYFSISLIFIELYPYPFVPPPTHPIFAGVKAQLQKRKHKIGRGAYWVDASEVEKQN